MSKTLKQLEEEFGTHANPLPTLGEEGFTYYTRAPTYKSGYEDIKTFGGQTYKKWTDNIFSGYRLSKYRSGREEGEGEGTLKDEDVKKEGDTISGLISGGDYGGARENLQRVQAEYRDKYRPGEKVVKRQHYTEPLEILETKRAPTFGALQADARLYEHTRQLYGLDRGETDYFFKYGVVPTGKSMEAIAEEVDVARGKAEAKKKKGQETAAKRKETAAKNKKKKEEDEAYYNPEKAAAQAYDDYVDTLGEAAEQGEYPDVYDDFAPFQTKGQVRQYSLDLHRQLNEARKRKHLSGAEWKKLNQEAYKWKNLTFKNKLDKNWELVSKFRELDRLEKEREEEAPRMGQERRDVRDFMGEIEGSDISKRVGKTQKIPAVKPAKKKKVVKKKPAGEFKGTEEDPRPQFEAVSAALSQQTDYTAEMLNIVLNVIAEGNKNAQPGQEYSYTYGGQTKTKRKPCGPGKKFKKDKGCI